MRVVDYELSGGTATDPHGPAQRGFIDAPP